MCRCVLCGALPHTPPCLCEIAPQLEKGWAKTFTALVCANFTSFWDGQTAKAVVRQRKAHTPKRELALFSVLWRLRALGRRRRPQNDSDIETNVIFALSFVWRNILTHIARCKSFRPAFSKGWRVWAEPSVLFDKSKFEARQKSRDKSLGSLL